MSENVREIILDSLLALEDESKKSHLLIRDVLDKYDYFDKRDKAFYKRVVEGTVSGRITLDYIIDSISKKPVAKCKPVVRQVLRMSAYQILFMEKVPDSAVCDEAVKLIRKRSFEEFTAFVNGILRKLSKEKKTLLDFSDIADECVRLSVKYSIPEWIVRMFKKEQKDINPEALLEALTKIKTTTVKIIDKASKEELLKEWEAEGILFTESKYVEDAYLIEGFEGISMVPGFDDGKLLVQDESSMLASMAAGVTAKDDLTIIDSCAAPGGKTSFVASTMLPKGHVYSFDVSEKKVSLIEENVSRMGLTNVSARVLDATTFDESLVEKADIVIADVPCSGLGVMGRKSDIKYHISNEAMKDICELQKSIVTNVSKYVKKSGVLIYSTCTIHKAENEKMVKFILDTLPFKPEALKGFLPDALLGEASENYIQLLPNVHGTDGFFVARFVKE